MLPDIEALVSKAKVHEFIICECMVYKKHGKMTIIPGILASAELNEYNVISKQLKAIIAQNIKTFNTIPVIQSKRNEKSYIFRISNKQELCIQLSIRVIETTYKN